MQVSDSFDVSAEQALEFDFELTLPANTPLSLGHCNVWIDTDLDIDYALDKSDKDCLNINPTPRQHAVLSGMNQLGFVLGEVECEQSKQLGGSFVQEFEFKPTGGCFIGRANEVEMLMVNNDDQLQLLIEVDRKAKGFGGFFAQALGQNESRLWLEVNDYEQSQVEAMLADAIESHC